MKKLLQFVALLLTLSLSAQPAFAESICAHNACGTSAPMDCCPPTRTTMPGMPMGMTSDQSRPVAAARMHCAGDSCCMVSAAIIQILPAPRLVTPVPTSLTVLPATSWIPSTLSLSKLPSIPPLVLPTHRYILFRDFRV